MPKSKAKSTESTASSWWKSRGEILSKKTESKAKPKSVRTKKAAKAEKGNTYFCEICGCEMECISDSAGNIMCCEEPMCLVI